MEELLKLTCNPKVGPGSTFSFSTMEEGYIFDMQVNQIICVCVCARQRGLREEQIRMHVHCCLSLSLLWQPSTRVASTLWEYYSKNLVSQNLQGNIEIRGFGDGRYLTDWKRSVSLDISPNPHQSEI